MRRVIYVTTIDVNGNYEPSNCRWVTQKQQCRNTRFNTYYTINNEMHCLIEWCEIYKVSYRTVADRLKRGLDIVEALTKPKNNLYTYNGETHDINTWSNITGIPHQTIRGRLWRGKSIEEALKGGNSHS